MSPARRRRAVLMLQERFGVSERWACRVTGQHRSTQRHRPDPVDADQRLRAQLREISAQRPRWGYRRAHVRLGELGHRVNRKRVQRLWREEGLRVPRRRRKRQRLGESTVPADRLRAERPDHVWALDFQFDQTADGRVLKLLNILSIATEKCRWIAIEKCRSRAHPAWASPGWRRAWSRPLRRKLGPLMVKTSASWSRRSRIAAARASSPKVSAHSATVLLLVTIVEPRV